MYTKSLVTMAQIYEAAQKLFVAKSYDEITMAEIAREANVTNGAIYHHINSKEELFLKMMEQYLERLEVHLKEAVDREGTTQARLTHLTELYLSLPLGEQRIIQLVRRDSNRWSLSDRRDARYILPLAVQ